MKKSNLILKKFSKRLVTLLLACYCPFLFGQNIGGYTSDYESAAKILRQAPKKPYEFSKAQLGDVLRFLAIDAGISFFTMPDGYEGLDKLITFTIRESPFKALETLCKTNGIVLVFDNGIWYMRPSKDEELIGRVYMIKYNTGEGGSNSQVGSTNSQIVRDITNLLGMSFTTKSANIVNEVASVGNFKTLPYANAFSNNTPIEEQLAIEEDSGENAGSAQVIWNSETNTLFVVATRQQHKWIEAYLNTVDKPQPMIAIEAKFFETSREPTSSYGIDWNLSGKDSRTDSSIDLSNGISAALTHSFTNPLSTILNDRQAKIAFQSLMSDGSATTVSYPRVLTRNNKKVTIQSNLETPVISTQTNFDTTSVSQATTSSVEMVSTGTTLEVTPKIMSDGDVLMDLIINHKDIAGEKTIGGETHPIINDRNYQSPIQVKSGYTVAIAGLDRAVFSESESGTPLLSEIPIIGLAFKKSSIADSKKHMMMFITPTIIYDASTSQGVHKRPQSLDPYRVHMDPPAFNENGMVGNSPEDRNYAIAFYENELNSLEHIIKIERMGSRENYAELNFIIKSCDAMAQQLTEAMYQQSGNPKMRGASHGLNQQISSLNNIRYRAEELMLELGTYLY